MRIPLKQIYDKAAIRPGGYVEDVLSHGTVVEDSLEISVEDFQMLKAKYRPVVEHTPAPDCQCCKKLDAH